MNARLVSIIADTLGMEERGVDASLSRDTAETWDSLNHLRLITAVEEAFEVTLSMAEIESVTTAAQLENCIGANAERG